MTKDIYTKKNIQEMTYAGFKAICHFRYILLCINVFCHTYLPLHRFLNIFLYITMSNHASIKNIRCK